MYKYAVCVSLAEEPSGKLRLVLDDIRFIGDSKGQMQHFAFFTEIHVDREGALSHTLTEDDYTFLGQAIMARLVALRLLD